MASIYEYYVTGDTGGGGIPWGDADDALAQTFTPENTHTVTIVKLKLFRVSTPGIINVDIYAVDGDHHPTGASLASGNTNGDTLTTDTAGSYRQITLDNTAVLQIGTEYALVLTAPNGVAGEKTVLWRIDIAESTYTRGLALKYIGDLEFPELQTWQVFSEGNISDFMFQEWGEDAVPSKPTNPSPANGATEEDFSALGLSWDDGGGADTYNVYMGPVGDLSLISSAQAETSLTVDYTDVPLEQVIYWRVDATNDAGTTTGDTWHFDARPAKPTNPGPSNTDSDIITGLEQLTWEAG